MFIGSARRVAHHTHSLGAARGVVWSWKCGNVAVVRPKGLIQPCQPRSKFGERTLKTIRAGLPLFHLKDWPSGNDTVYRELVVSSSSTQDWAEVGQA